MALTEKKHNKSCRSLTDALNVDYESVPVTTPAEVTKFDSGDGVTVGGAHPADNISVNTVVGWMTDIFPHAHPVESSLNKEGLKLLKCGVSGVAKINLQVMRSVEEDFTE